MDTRFPYPGLLEGVGIVKGLNLLLCLRLDQEEAADHGFDDPAPASGPDTRMRTGAVPR